MAVWEQAAEASPAALFPRPPVPRAAHRAGGISPWHGEPAPAPGKTWRFGGKGALTDCRRLRRGREHRWHHVPSLLSPAARGTSGVVSRGAEPHPGRGWWVRRMPVSQQPGPLLGTVEAQGCGVQTVCIPARGGLWTPSHRG